MLLEQLLSVVETLRGRIAAHSPALRQSDALTRYALIGPLLRGQSWDTADPSQVLVEYHSGGGSADYALLDADGKPRIIVEAKKLGAPLQAAVQQVIKYCIIDGFPYFAVTDGRHWELYDTHHPGPLSDKLVMGLDVAGSAAATCLDALALWRPAAATGDIKPAAAPVIHPTPTVESLPHTSLPHTSLPHTDVTSDEANPHDWHALLEYSPPPGSKPQAIRLRSRDVRTAGSWAALTVAAVRWLHEAGHLNESHLPIQRSKKTYIVASTPRHATGTTFRAARQVGPHFVNVNYSARDHVRNIGWIVKRTGQDPAEFAVRLAK